MYSVQSMPYLVSAVEGKFPAPTWMKTLDIQITELSKIIRKPAKDKNFLVPPTQRNMSLQFNRLSFHASGPLVSFVRSC